MRSKLALLFSLVLVAGLAVPSSPGDVGADDRFTLTILHNNDADSRLLNRGEGLEDFGGAARFKALVDAERSKAPGGPNAATVLLSGGNSIEVGPQAEASLARGVPFYDSIAMRTMGYDAAVLGHKEFGLGPDVLAGFICGFSSSHSGYPECDVEYRPAFPFLSANLTFEHEPHLQALAEHGAIAASTVITKGEQRIGVVGITTPDLAVLSSPRNTTVHADIARRAQQEIDRLESMGVKRIILLSQLQGIAEEKALVGALRGVDVVVAGGTGSMMTKSNGLLVPGDRFDPNLSYPVYADSADGASVPIVSVIGAYSYLGKLVVEFNAEGEVVWVDPGSGPIRVASPAHAGGVVADPILVSAIDRPVRAFLDGLAQDVIGTSEVALEGRTTVIRTRETNLGNLMADAALWYARERAAEFGVARPDVAILNAGGIRLDKLRAPGPLSHLETFEIAPFASFISVIEGVSPETLKLAMENAVSKLPNADGRFGQIAGFSVTIDPAREALAFDAAGRHLNEGARVRSIRLDDGTYIVREGAVVPGAPSVTVAAIDFMARGGDQYPFAGAFTTLGVSYQQALEAYVIEALGGVIRASQYAEGGGGRIVGE